MSNAFSGSALALAGHTARLLGWTPETFWNATPQELEAKSRYHNAVTLVVEEPEKVASRLSELPGARKVELREGELTVFPSEGAELLDVVSGAVRENQWEVSALRLEAGRLDEVFRQVTKEASA